MHLEQLSKLLESLVVLPLKDLRHTQQLSIKKMFSFLDIKITEGSLPSPSLSDYLHAIEKNKLEYELSDSSLFILKILLKRLNPQICLSKALSLDPEKILLPFYLAHWYLTLGEEYGETIKAYDLHSSKAYDLLHSAAKNFKMTNQLSWMSYTQDLLMELKHSSHYKNHNFFTHSSAEQPRKNVLVPG